MDLCDRHAAGAFEVSLHNLVSGFIKLTDPPSDKVKLNVIFLLSIAVVFDGTPVRPMVAGMLKAEMEGTVRTDDAQVKLLALVFLVPVVVAFLFVIFIFYRARREAFFKQRDAETRLKALRAQINPHFIFNCLSSIYYYIPPHRDADPARAYLEKFSHLIRYVLETSSERWVPLEDELDALKRYLELEQRRMKDSFVFEIVTHELPHYQSIYIPPMMIQPFVENSIWHGMNNDNRGFIRIALMHHGTLLRCIIEDNGRLQNERRIKPMNGSIKKTSMGMILIKERLEAINRLHRTKAKFILQDRRHDSLPIDGTRVILDLPFED